MRQSSTGTASASSSQSSLEGDYETNIEIEALEPLEAIEPVEAVEAGLPVQVNTFLP